MKSISEACAITRTWLANFWRTRSRARELGRQYRVLWEECPLVLADLALFGCANSSTHVQGDLELSQQNVGRREMWLHIKQMAALTDEDVRHLEEETERDG